MLEITEGVIMNERSVAIKTMSAFASWEWGCRWTISEPVIRASAARAFAHCELKIDRSFICDVESDVSGASGRYTVIRVGQSLHLTVVAEGVEPRAARFTGDLDATLFRDFSTPRPCRLPRSGVAA